MHFYLFISGNSPEDVPSSILTDYTRQVFPVQTIKEARELISYTKNGFSQKTSLVIPNFDQTSIEAQNALLKTFEEPSTNTAFIVTARSTMGVAETILSRAFVVENDEKSQFPYEKEVNDFLRHPEKRLSITAEFKDRDEAGYFIQSLLKKAMTELPYHVQEITDCYNAIKGNGNVSLHLTNLVVKLSDK